MLRVTRLTTLMLSLCFALSAGALCENYDEPQCAQMNDGGCGCVWKERNGAEACTKGDVCGGIGITALPTDTCTTMDDCRTEADYFCGYDCVEGNCDRDGPMWCEQVHSLECTAPDGSVVAPGETYTAADGCNTCTCAMSPEGAAEAFCTEMMCELPCTPCRRKRSLLFASTPDDTNCCT